MTDHDSHLGKPVDRDLETLSRSYKEASQNVSTDEPPPSVDNAIRAAARRAVNARPQSVKKRWYARWDSPVAMAAVIVLTVSVTMVLVDEQPDLAPAAVQTALKPGAAPTVTASAPAAEPPLPRSPFAESTAKANQEVAKELPPVSIREMGRRDAAPPASSGRIEADSVSRMGPAEPRNRAAPAPVPPAEPPVMAEKRAEFVADPELQSQMKKMEAPASAASSNAIVPQAPAPASSRAPAHTPAPLQNLAESQAQSQIKGRAKDSLDAARVQVTPKPAEARPALATAPAVFPPSPAKSVVAPSPMADTPMESFTASAKTQRTASAAGEAMAKQKSDRQESGNAFEEIRSPEEWLKHISALRKRGNIKEAEDQLAKFRKRYPDYALPVEFRR